MGLNYSTKSRGIWQECPPFPCLVLRKPDLAKVKHVLKLDILCNSKSYKFKIHITFSHSGRETDEKQKNSTN